MSSVADICIYVLDAGSVKKGAAAWASSERRPDECEKGLADLADRIVSDLKERRMVALGFESVQFIPCPHSVAELAKSRPGECTPETGNKPFCAGPAPAATMVGFQALAWLLRRVKSQVPQLKATTSWSDFLTGDASLFVWEAFVSGYEKGTDHYDDALLAVESFEAHIDVLEDSTTVTAASPISLAAALLLWAGLTRDTELLHQPCIVLRPVVSQAIVQSRREKAESRKRQKRERKKQFKKLLEDQPELDLLYAQSH